MTRFIPDPFSPVPSRILTLSGNRPNSYWAALTAVVFLILLGEVADAQISSGRFRIDAQVVQTKRGSPVYSGYIYNDGGGGVANIRLLVETLDAEGKVIGQGEGAALGSMLGRDRLYFEVPLQTTGVSYRVRVLSWGTFATGQ
jgi:hypothetical protein